MIPVVVFWTKYTATLNGQFLKLVPCENCATEYVYVLEREGTGVGTSVYALNDDGARDHAVLTSDEEKILAWVREKGSINNVECRKLLGVSVFRASRVLKALHQKGLLNRVGEKRWARYESP